MPEKLALSAHRDRHRSQRPPIWAQAALGTYRPSGIGSLSFHSFPLGLMAVIHHQQSFTWGQKLSRNPPGLGQMRFSEPDGVPRGRAKGSLSGLARGRKTAGQTCRLPGLLCPALSLTHP